MTGEPGVGREPFLFIRSSKEISFFGGTIRRSQIELKEEKKLLLSWIINRMLSDPRLTSRWNETLRLKSVASFQARKERKSNSIPILTAISRIYSLLVVIF